MAKYQLAFIVRAKHGVSFDDAEMLYERVVARIHEAFNLAGVEVVEHDAYEFTNEEQAK